MKYSGKVGWVAATYLTGTNPNTSTTSSGTSSSTDYSTRSAEEKLFAAVVYAEAGGQSRMEKRIVAHSIKNRVNYGEWKSKTSISAVVQQSGQYEAYNNQRYKNAVNFYNTGQGSSAIENGAMSESMEVISPIYSGSEADFTNKVVFFHSFKNASDWKYHSAYFLATDLTGVHLNIIFTG